MSDARKIEVEIPGSTYPVWIGDGILGSVGDYLAPLAITGKVAVVTDSQVAKHHLRPLLRRLREAGIDPVEVVVPAGEKSKSLDVYRSVLDRLLDRAVGRDGAVIALGGGMVGDLAGFAAATLYRGVAVIQAPTTLLAQVDSSIGGKTGINVSQGKNLVGAFHQPACVIADGATLDTLPRRETVAGYAEVAKAALLGDSELFAWLEENAEAALSGNRTLRGEMVARAAGIKAGIVAGDETERGGRALLNLGHTVGHAIEAEDGYRGRVSHGEAVATGMAVIAEFSRRMGWCDGETSRRVRDHLRAAGLPATLGELDADSFDVKRLVDRMRHDKKVRGGSPVLVLLRGIGEAGMCRKPDMALLQEVIEESRHG